MGLADVAARLRRRRRLSGLLQRGPGLGGVRGAPPGVDHHTAALVGDHRDAGLDRVRVRIAWAEPDSAGEVTELHGDDGDRPPRLMADAGPAITDPRCRGRESLPRRVIGAGQGMRADLCSAYAYAPKRRRHCCVG